MSQALLNVCSTHGVQAYQSVHQNSHNVVESAIKILKNLADNNIIKKNLMEQCSIAQTEKDRVVALCGKLKSVNCPVRTAVFGRTGMASLTISLFLGIPGWIISTAVYFISDAAVTINKIEENNLAVCQAICQELITIGRDRAVRLAEIERLIQCEINALINENERLEQQDRIKGWYGYLVSLIQNPSSNNPFWQKNTDTIETLLKVQNLVAEMHAHYRTWLTTSMKSKQTWSVGPCVFDVTYNTTTKDFVIVPKA